MGTLGERFRKQRELQGVSWSEIAARTHIGARMLQAIEEEAYERLPGGIFNKSFIRQYAACLGMDEEQAVRDYLRATARQTQEASAPNPPPQGRLLTIGRRAVIAIVLGAAGLGGFWLHRSRSPKAAPLQAQALSATPSAVPVTEAPGALPDSHAAAATAPTRSGQALTPSSDSGPVNAEGEPLSQTSRAPAHAPGVSAASGSNPAVASAGAPDSGELLLQINAHSTVWISVITDGGQKWQGTLQANETRQVQAVESIRLTAGNAGGLSLNLNGKDIGAMGGEGEVKTITLMARALPEAAQ